jgi:peptidoglycan/LPS O-acetylase OafA/YrhL
VETVQPVWWQVLVRATVVFVATWVLFYFTVWDEASPIYTDSDRTITSVIVGSIGIGVLLVAVRQRRWGVAWLIGSVCFVGGYIAVVLFSFFVVYGHSLDWRGGSSIRTCRCADLPMCGSEWTFRVTPLRRTFGV